MTEIDGIASGIVISLKLYSTATREQGSNAELNHGERQNEKVSENRECMMLVYI